MTKTLKDDQGNKYELVPHQDNGNAWSLRPVQPEEEKSVYIRVNFADWISNTDNPLYLQQLPNLTQSQATALATAISVVVSFCQGEGRDNGQWPVAVVYARRALQGRRQDE